jgi:hypothetical protein
MKLPRAAVFGFLTAVSLGACSKNDTIVSVNASLAGDVGLINNIRVTVAQPGQSPVTADFLAPTSKVDAGPDDAGNVQINTINPSAFYERVTLPDGWEGQSTVTAQVTSGAGLPVLEATATVQIEKEKVTAAWLNFTRTPPATGGTAGSANGGAGGEQAGQGGGGGEVAGGAGGAGGESAGGTGGAGGAS